MATAEISRDRGQVLQVVRVVAEYGLEFARDDAGTWVVVDRWRPGRKVDLGQVWRKHRIRPVVAWVENRSGCVSPRVLPPDFQVDRLEAAPACLREMLAPTIGLPAGMFMYGYFVHAIVYRLRALAVAYARQAKVYPACFADGPEVGRVGENMVAGAQEVSFEAEALITCAIRFVEALIEPFWQRFGDDSPRPNGWCDALKRCSHCPEPLEARLQKAWRSMKHLNQYRNYIEHVAPPGGVDPGSTVRRFGDLGDGAGFCLPDDPRVRDAKQATYKRQVDALSYCWEEVTNVIGIARDLLRQVYANSPPE